MTCSKAHIDPTQYQNKNGKAYCPHCNKFMGYYATKQDEKQAEPNTKQPRKAKQ